MKKKTCKEPEICAGQVLLGTGPALRGIVYLATLLEKINFLLTSDCQVEMASWTGMGAPLYFPLRIGTSSDLDLCNPCVCYHSLHSL